MAVGKAYWDFGIELVNSTTAKISMFNIQGSERLSGIAAIQVRGAAAPDKARQVHRSPAPQWHDREYVRGLEAKDHAEGMHVQEVAFREVG